MSKQLQQLSAQLGKWLRQSEMTITCAESCTGGLIAMVITDTAGSSAYFQHGFVTYSNDAKRQILGVKAQTLDAYGAESEAVVLEMAKGALQAAQADIAVSVSGIAGPDGGSIEKPVGTVWFGFANKAGQIFALRRCFIGSRSEVREQAAQFALETAMKKFI